MYGDGNTKIVYAHQFSIQAALTEIAFINIAWSGKVTSKCWLDVISGWCLEVREIDYSNNILLVSNSFQHWSVSFIT